MEVIRPRGSYVHADPPNPETRRSAESYVEATVAVGVFGAQLILNAAWSPAFFTLQSPGLALAIIIPMLILIALSIVLFRRVSPLAGWLLVPYLAWVSFATYLNASIWWLNR